MIEIKKLKNNITVVLEEIPYVRSISFGIWIKNGSRNENINVNGISHFIEHMLFKGTKNRSARDIAEAMDSVGGQINAYTTKEYTCYHTRILDKHFHRAIDVMSDMLLNSKFDDKDINRERNVIIEEINMYEDSPEELVHDCLQEKIWGNSHLSLPILGTEESITQFNTNIIKDYFYKNYVPENTVISVAGNFKSDYVLEEIENYFGNWNNIYLGERNIKNAVYTPCIVKRPKNIEQVHICMAFPGFERDSKYKYALTIFNTIFGGGLSSRLFQKVREENGLTYSIYSYTSSYVDVGLFSIYAGMNPNQIEKVIKLIFNEIEDLKTNKISNKIINITKEQIISNFIIGSESTVNRMTASGASVLLRGKIQDVEEIISNIEKVTSEDIYNLVNLIFDYENISLSAVGKIDDINFEKILEKKYIKNV